MNASPRFAAIRSRFRHVLHHVAPFFLAIFLLACSQMRAEGLVTDSVGTPQENVVVTAIGTHCQAYTDSTGHYSLSCPPGIYSITFSQTGYINQTLDQVDLQEKRTYEIPQVHMVRIPQDKGLLLFRGNEYHKLKPGHLRRKMGGSGISQFKWYCLEPAKSEANVFKPGVHTFFDNESVGWRPFKLDKQKCAYRMSPRSRSNWGVDYDEKASFEEQRLAEGKKLVDITLEPGEYFIADWERGFFTKAPGQKNLYTGYYIQVVP